MSEQEATYEMDKFPIRVRMEEEGKVVEEEVDSANADITKINLTNTASTTGKTLQTCKAERLGEGGAIMPDQVDKTTPPSVDTVANSAITRESVEKRRVSRLSQAKTHQLCLKLRLRRSWQNVCNEAQSELSDDLQPNQHLQIRKCIVYRLGCIQSRDV